MDTKEKIYELVESVLDEKHFIVEVLFKQQKPISKLTIYLDGDEGIQIEVCAEVSRKLSEMLDELDLIEGEFNLEVSSPGADKPLLKARQFVQHTGRTLQVALLDGQIIEGTLKESKPEGLIIELPQTKKNKTVELLEVAHTNIKEAKVLVSFK